jgi:hypothetical protein
MSAQDLGRKLLGDIVEGGLDEVSHQRRDHDVKEFKSLQFS